MAHRRPRLPLVKIATRLSTLRRRRRRRRHRLASTSTSSTSLHPKPSPAGAARAFPRPRRRIRPTRAGCSPAWTTRGDRLETRRPRLGYAGGDGVCPERDRRGGHHGTLGRAWVALSGSFRLYGISGCNSPAGLLVDEQVLRSGEEGLKDVGPRHDADGHVAVVDDGDAVALVLQHHAGDGGHRRALEAGARRARHHVLHGVSA